MPSSPMSIGLHPITYEALMSLSRHFHPTPTHTAPLSDIDHLGMVEASLEAETASALLERQLDALNTQSLIETLSEESGALSDSAQYWKDYAQAGLNSQLSTNFEADDGKSLWRRMIDAIKAFFKKIADSFKSFWEKATKGIAVIEDEANRLKKAAGKLKGDPKKKDFDSAYFGKLGKGNKSPEPKVLSADLEYMAHIVEEVVSSGEFTLKVADDYLKTLESIEKTLPVVTRNPVAAQVLSLAKAHTYKYIGEKDTVFDLATSKTLEAKQTRELPGGVILGYTNPHPMVLRSYAATEGNITAVKDSDKYGGLMLAYRALKAKTDHDSGKSGNVPTLKKDEIIDLCDHCVKMAKTFRSYNDNNPARNKRVEAINKASDKLSADLEEHGDGLGDSQKGVVKDTLSFSKALMNVMFQMPLSVDAAVLGIITDTLKYCKASIDNH